MKPWTRWLFRLIASYLAAHGYTVASQDQLTMAAGALADFARFTGRSGHLTRAYHAGKVARDVCGRAYVYLTAATHRVW